MAEEVITSAKVYTELWYPDDNGVVWLTELQNLKASKGISDPRLELMIPPSEAIFIWNLYWGKFRSTGVTFTEIANYNNVCDTELTGWEIEILFSIHNTVEGTISDILKKQRNK